MQQHVVIAGAGPAGLTAAHAIVTARPRLNVLLLEAGRPFRRRPCPVDKGFGCTAELPEWEHEALLSLLVDPILPGRTGFINGSHRSQAMLDQGVRQVLVVEYVDPPDRAEADAALEAWAAKHAPGRP